METDEIYDVLMEQFLKAAAKYDPNYVEKLQLVVEEGKRALSKRGGFRSVDVARNLEFDVARYLRLLCRRGFLVSERQAEEDESITFAVHFPGRVCISSSGPDRGFASGIASTAQAVFWPI